MIKSVLAYCGLDCDSCPAFVATRNDDIALKRKTAKEWTCDYSQYLGGRTLSVEDINCRGCHSEAEVLFVGCSICPIRKCAREKNVKNCAYCSEFENCEMITGFFSCHEQARRNLKCLRDRTDN